MPANQFGIDLGSMYQDVEAIKNSRSQGKLNALRLQAAEKAMKDEEEAKAASAERNVLLTGLRKEAVAGSEDATKQLLALDPEGGASFIDAIGKMDKTKLEATKRTVEEVGQLSAYVLQGSSPEEQSRRYSLVYQSADPAVKSRLPDTFDPNFMELSLSKAMAMDKLLENPKVIQVGNQDIAYQRGREIARGTVPDKRGGEGGSGTGIGELKSADESLMYRQASELLGGVFDQNGNITNLDPDTRNKAQAIATEAVKIYRQQGNISRTEAVQQAGRKFGINIKTAEEFQGAGQNSDPLGIR